MFGPDGTGYTFWAGSGYMASSFLPSPHRLFSLPRPPPRGQAFVSIRGRDNERGRGSAGMGKQGRQWRVLELHKSRICYIGTCRRSNCFSLITLPYHPSSLTPSPADPPTPTTHALPFRLLPLPPVTFPAPNLLPERSNSVFPLQRDKSCDIS